MTRGRDSNIAYVALDQPDNTHPTPKPDDITARTVLFGVLNHSGASLSAHQTMEAEYALHGGIDRLAAELETIAADAQRQRFVDLLRRSGLTPEQHETVVRSSALGPLMASLRRAEASHHELEKLVRRCVGLHALDDAGDIAAVLRYRIEQAAASPPRDCTLAPRLIAGLIPAPLGEMPAEHRKSIDERADLIETRARALVAAAVDIDAPWCRHLGTPPTEPQARDLWTQKAATVAAYRDRYPIDRDVPLGGGATNDDEQADRRRAQRALREAICVSETAQPAHRREAPELLAVSAR
jgi:hypothetical protein